MYCGIDVSKGKSNICILDSQKNVVREFEIKHDKSGFEELEKYLTKNTKIGLETTGSYCKALYHYLKGKYDVSYVDNYQLKTFARLENARVKNDKVDAKRIAEFMSFDFKRINQGSTNVLMDLSRLYQKTLKQMTRYKFMFLDQVGVIFPELEKNYSINSAKAIPLMLLKYPSPQEIAEASTEDVRKALIENLRCSAKFTLEFASKLQGLAKNSVGVKDYPTSCFKYTIKIMLYYQDLVKDIISEMSEELKKTPYYNLTKLFGFSDISVATIVGEVGDIRRFSNHKKFIRYIGFDVSEKQSGTYSSVNCHITKRGNAILRFTFYNLVLCHLRTDDEIAIFYKRLKENGKHPKKCMVAAARKIAIKTYYEMLRCHINP